MTATEWGRTVTTLGDEPGEDVPPPTDDDYTDEPEPPPFPDEVTAGKPRPVADPWLVDAVAEQLGVTRAEAELIAPQIGDRIAYERTVGVARRLVRDQQLEREADFAGIDVVPALALLSRDRPARRRVLGDLVLEGHNVTVVSEKKGGKTTFAGSVIRSVVTGEDFLGRFPVPEPLRVAFFNYELDERDMDLRIRRLGLDDQALERLLVVNLRGRRLPIMTPAGRRWTADVLADHRTDLWIVDPFGAAYASSGGESENDNAEVRRFTIALDEIKRLADVATLVMPVHTGAAVHEAGTERARGATVLEDWPDVLMYLTKDKDEQRFLRTDGRAPYRLYESRLGFDEATGRLMLATTDLGLSRTKAKKQGLVDLVIKVVRDTPGLKNGDLNQAVVAAGGPSNNQERPALIADVLAQQLIHRHPGRGTAQLHYEGPDHDPNDPCPGGWEPA